MKNAAFFFLLIPFLLFGQKQVYWHLLDPDSDNMLGISANKSQALLKNKKPETVVVAVIDNGTDYTHSDLQGRIWVNEDEIDGNGIDDDHNGYIDDIHGWNYLGNKNGDNLKDETVELTRCYLYYQGKFGGKTASQVAATDKNEYEKYLQIKSGFENEIKDKNNSIRIYQDLIDRYYSADQVLRTYFCKEKYENEDVYKIKTREQEVLEAKKYMIYFIDNKLSVEMLEKYISNTEKELKTRYNPDFNPRKEIVGDNPDDLNDTLYGNNIVNARGPVHGTSVASVIAALDNDSGAVGVAQNVKIMILRVVPNGDERDKDIALAFRYAVRNGAKIINCSFGRHYSLHPEFLYDAMKEAEDAGVLIVNGAGNDENNNDEKPFYPTGTYQNGQKAGNWITVAASGQRDNERLAAYFTNYGQKTVDVFAPGIDIEACTLNNKSEAESGTSIAAPVVSGIAAVIKSYYPFLTGQQIREIIMASVYIPRTENVILPGTRDQKVKFGNLSVSGGIVNLYNALIYAEKKYGKQ